jgi:hypothetical protein
MSEFQSQENLPKNDAYILLPKFHKIFMKFQ